MFSLHETVCLNPVVHCVSCCFSVSSKRFSAKVSLFISPICRTGTDKTQIFTTSCAPAVISRAIDCSSAKHTESSELLRHCLYTLEVYFSMIFSKMLKIVTFEAISNSLKIHNERVNASFSSLLYLSGLTKVLTFVPFVQICV